MEMMEVRSPKKGVWRESLKKGKSWQMMSSGIQKRRSLVGGGGDEEMPGRNGQEKPLFLQVTFFIQLSSFLKIYHHAFQIRGKRGKVEKR